jgi:hypothetical protein
MEWYEKVTADELAAIKAAMVGGPGGIATHSGHWYNCQNGHPVSCIQLIPLVLNLVCALRGMAGCLRFVPTWTPFAT